MFVLTVIFYELEKVSNVSVTYLLHSEVVRLLMKLSASLSFSIPNIVHNGVLRRFFSPLPSQSISLNRWTVVKANSSLFKKKQTKHQNQNADL
jgi:hypothetical protein